MITHLRLRTEYSFQQAAGTVKDVLKASGNSTHAGIADRNGTWGHVKWKTACKEVGKKPVYGVELAIVPDMEERERQPASFMTLIARNTKGLREIYEAVTLATEKFYYIPRLDYKFLRGLSKDVLILSGSEPDWELLPRKMKNFYVELNPMSEPRVADRAKGLGYQLVATCDNLYPTPDDRGMYEVILGERMRSTRTLPAHILSIWEWERFCGKNKAAIELAHRIATECEAELPHAKLVHPDVKDSLVNMCLEGASKRGISLKKQPQYRERLNRELALIADKEFEDYFFVVADMVNWAKQRMLVGPARGSSCGSLVCYFLGITDIDPLPFDLLFERFIDVNREDLPDIDIDFQDDKRESVFDYVREKYGVENVSRLGTLSVYKAKSTLGDCAKELGIPQWEITDLKNSIIERSTGDSRAQFCIMDTFEQLDIGKNMLKKYPELAIAARVEGHVSHTGKHAAGILITAHPVVNYCAVNQQTGTAMIDKKDAEKLDLLKIDALGLRTLSILQDCLDQVGWTREQLRDYPIDDQEAFKLINEGKFAGIFQYEGYALQSLCKQMPIKEFEDVAVITALARPGPLSSGGASEFIKRRTGQTATTYLHPLVKDITKVTYGVIVYQEQVMQIARTVGALSWEDVSQLRKAMSKSLGKEFFDGYWKKFWAGAKEKGLSEETAQKIWDNINTMGSWAFNRSHAVAYGMVSYWCLVLKSKFPLQFAAACLRNAKDDDQSIKILRELVTEGYKYRPYCPVKSGANWSVVDGELLGGIIGIKGIGAKLAESIIRKRSKGIELSPREKKLLAEGKTPWDCVFETVELWGHILRDPMRYNITSPICVTNDIGEDSNGEFVFIAKIKEKKLRDHNELQALQRRSMKRMEGQTLYLHLTLEDDTGSITATINRYDYLQWGYPLVESAKIGDWFIWKGKNRSGFRRVNVARWKKLTDNPEYARDIRPEKILKKDVANSSSKAEGANRSEGNPSPKKSKPNKTKSRK